VTAYIDYDHKVTSAVSGAVTGWGDALPFCGTRADRQSNHLQAVSKVLFWPD